MPATTKRRLGVLIAQHPAINHAMLLREVRELRERFEVFTASVRDPDRPSDKLTPEESDEVARTYYVKQHGIRGALAAHLACLFARPAKYLAGWVYALGLAGANPLRAFRYSAYYTEALMLGQWMQRNRIPHLHVHYSSTVGLLLKQVFPAGLSISFHGPDEFDNPSGFHIAEKVRACDFVRAISQYARSQLMKASEFEQWRKMEVVYMGVDPAVFATRPFRTEPSPLELICVGRLAPVKAQHILIAVMDRLVRRGNDVRLNLVGGGPDRQRLQADVAARGLGEHIIFHGFTPQDKLDALYRSADVFVLASFAEGVPGVLMEAMAMEIPCVSTWITGVPELIRDGRDGLLVAPSDDEGFATAVARLLDDTVFRYHVGQAGRERILERFDLKKNAAQLGDIFERYLQG